MESEDWSAFGLPSGFGLGSGIKPTKQVVEVKSNAWSDSGFETLPKSIHFQGVHKKTVSCVAMEGSGARFVTGSHDSSLAYWDWSTMSDRPFRLIEAMEGTALHSVQWSADDGQLLCAGGLVKARLFDRHGSMVAETGVGDRYLVDLKRTEGHVAALTVAKWNVRAKDAFYTASQDGTVRRWRVGKGSCRQESVILNQKGRMAVCQVQMHDDKLLTLASDGMLRLWTPSNTLASSVAAHEANAYVTALVARPGCEWQWATRATDHTVKLWDLRNLKTHVTATALNCMMDETGLAWSPEGDCLVTGTSVKNGGKEVAELVSLNLQLEIQARIPMHNTSVVAMEWHPRLNQLMLGHGNGSWSILLHPDTSKRGALSIPQTAKPDISDTPQVGPIIIPDADTIITEDDRGGKYRDRRNPLKSRRPDLPLDGPSRQGRPGATTITQSIMKRVLPDHSRNEDPREALLKYAKIAEEDPKYITPAYQKTQPKPVFKPDK